MNLQPIIDNFIHIESLINDLISLYGLESDGLNNDATLVISTVQELRFEI